MSIQDLCIVGEDKLKRSFILPKRILWKQMVLMAKDFWLSLSWNKFM